MTLAGATSGLTAVAAYFGAVFLPLPDGLSRLLAFAFGPLLAVSFLGLYHVLADRRDGPALRFGVVLGILAGATVTVMLSVQMGNNMIQADQLAGADTEAARLAHQAVNRVQMLIDVAWDVFICGAGGLVGLAMLRHPRFGWIWGGTGIAASVALLYLNLDTFPQGPAYAGSVDLGPLLALWFMAVYAWTLALTLRDRRSLG
jgi:hypothetical protein